VRLIIHLFENIRELSFKEISASHEALLGDWRLCLVIVTRNLSINVRNPHFQKSINHVKIERIRNRIYGIKAREGISHSVGWFFWVPNSRLAPRRTSSTPGFYLVNPVFLDNTGNMEVLWS
jgi:hypothetical protein